MNFKVVLLQEEDGSYIVSCPAIPGCHSQGDSLDEALENIKEAIVGCLESLADERTRLLGASERIMEVLRDDKGRYMILQDASLRQS